MQIKALYFAVEPLFQFIFHKTNFNLLTRFKVSSIYVRSAEKAAGYSISPISHDQNSTDFIKIVVNCFIFAARPEKRKSDTWWAFGSNRTSTPNNAKQLWN